MDPSGTTPMDPATLMWRGAGGTHDSMASSSENDEQQARNDQLFVAIRKKIPETSIIQEIEKLLNSGAEINAFNTRHKTVLDVALDKKYDCLEKYLIGRGGKTAYDVEHNTDDVHEHIKVNSTNNDEDILEKLNAESELQEERKALIRCRIDDKQRELDDMLKNRTNNLTQDKLEKLNALLKSELQTQEVLEALKRCGIDVNYRDSRFKQSAIDKAWDNEYYDVMLILIMADSKFPIDFGCLNMFYENQCIPDKLKAFVRERQTMHEWIRNDELEKVRKYVAVHELSNFYNCENKSALEIAVGFASVDTLASLLGIILPSQEITFSEEQSKLLQQLNTEGNTLLSVAAKWGKRDNVDFLIKCDINVNHPNKYKEIAVDLAWHNEHFDVVHKLLEADSNYPIYFDMAALNVADAKDLRQFVERRNNLHKLIKENCLVEIEEFVAHDKSTLYLNSEGKSALATALESKRFEIYAFLKTIGLTFKNEDEDEYLNKLSPGEKDSLKTAMIRKFPQIDKGHILFLMSKSRSKNPIEHFNKKIENIYRYLDDIPEISKLMQALQYIEYLDLVFDFNKKDVKDINPTVSKSCRGITDYKEGRIYVAAGRDEEKVAGTLAHELAHLAMYFLYENKCNPFDKVGNYRHRFEKIMDTIKETLKETMARMTGNEDNPEIMLARVFKYDKEEQPSELIVRVPHILAQYSSTGRNLFISREEFKLLFDYYNNREEGGLMYRCDKLIENSFFIKPRKCIQIFNETVGKIHEIIKHELHFVKCTDLDTFLKSKTQVFLLETESTFLSTLNVYESLIIRNKKNSLQNSFFLEFNSYIEKEDEILKLFYSPEGKVLCISFSYDSSKEQIADAMNNIKDILSHKPDKKVIFIIQESETEILYKLTSEFNDNCEKSVHHKFTLNDFSEESQQKLLERKITFQGESINLNKLIDILDANAKTVIDTNILVKLIKGERIEIGRRPPDTSDLEGAYSELFQEIDINIFVDKLLEQNPREIYIISGISGTNKQDRFINCLLLNKTEDINKTPKVNALKRHIEVLDLQEISRDITKSIQVTGDQFKAKHFKQLCHNYSAVKIYWIHQRYENEESQFILQRIYNPDFYVTGDRVSDEVVIEKSVVEELTSSELTERFIITMNKPSDMQKWFQLQPEQEKQFKHNMQNEKITFVYLQDGDEDYFPESVEGNETVHLLNLKDDHLIWENTFGSYKILMKYRAKDYKNTRPLMKENLVVAMIQEKVSIIAGDPGTGKSTIITRLYNAQLSSKAGRVDSIMQSHWVVKVNLKDYVAVIKNMTSDLSEMTEFLLQVDKNLSDNTSQTLAQRLIGMSLQNKNFMKPLLIIFDGFDEVLDEANRNKIITLLQYLQDKTNAKLCITTRLHYEQDLEGALSKFAMKLEPMDDSTIHKFITKSLSNRLSLKISQDKFSQFFANDGERMLKYSDAFLKKMQEVFKNDVTKFIGTPLQLYLMLENSVDSFLEWIKDDSKVPEFSFLGNDIWEVYENFVDKKYDYFIKTKTGEKEEMLHQEDVKHLDKYHMDFAKSIIFKSDTKESINEIRDIILSVGIVRSEGNHLGFIHPTFAEYFAAKALVYWIRKWEKGRFINFAKQEYFFTTILRKSDYRVVRAFLNAKLLKEKDTSIKLKNKYFDISIFRLAAEENHVGIAKFIFDNFTNVDVNVDNYGDRVLNIAAKAGHLEIVKFLLDKDANVNAGDWTRQTALIIAAKFGHLEITKLLLDKGVDVKAVDKWRQTALHVACRSGHLEIVKLLIDKDAHVNAGDQHGQTALTIAAESGHLEITKILLDKGADADAIDEWGQTALHLACRSGHLEIVKLLIDNDANMNAGERTRQTAVKKAAASGHIEITKFLIDKVADVNVGHRLCRAALHSACKSGHLEIVKFLLDKDAIVNAGELTRQTALTMAVAAGHLEITKLLIEKGANVNAGNQVGQKPLTTAAACGHLEITKWLVDKVADLNADDNCCRTALFYASRCGYLEIVKLLIDKGAKVDIKDEDGKTALIAADENGHTDIVKLLKTYYQKELLITVQKRGAKKKTVGNSEMASAKRRRR